MDRFLEKLERKMGRFYISGLMRYVCFGMAGIFILDLLFSRSAVSASSFLAFSRPLILRGQIWRLFTFIFIPPDSSLLFIVFALYFYYILGTALENRWGSRRFNLYYLIGILGADIGGMLLGFNTNYYLNLSLFLAFACLYPDFEVLVFFILPVKMKYIAWLDAALRVLEFVSATWPARGCLLFSMLPFFLFFGKDLYLEARRLLRKLSR